jgi:DNA polymerase Ligase (LigD)
MSESIEQRRFVVLEHEWNGIHWDFMIEDKGRLRTWAIDAPLISAVELPARALPDHRLDYLTYEGPISGGRGRVRRVDGGTFHELEWGPHRVRGTLAGGQLVGEVVVYCVDSASPCSSPWKFRLGKVD